MSGSAREEDGVEGKCNGDYDNWEVTGYGAFGAVFYGWVTENEDGTITSSKLKSVSTDVFINGKSASKKGDTMEITKSYSNQKHHDALSVTGTISSGSSTVFINGKAMARKGDSITATNCSGVIIKDGSTNVLAN